MTEILFEKHGLSIRAIDERGWKFVNKLPNHCQFVADVKDPTRRSGEQHRFWFALCNELYANQTYYPDIDSFRQGLLIHLGYCHVFKRKNGTEFPIAKSLKYGKMPADEFGALVDATLNFAVEMGWDRDELLAQTRAAA